MVKKDRLAGKVLEINQAVFFFLSKYEPQLNTELTIGCFLAFARGLALISADLVIFFLL